MGAWCGWCGKINLNWCIPIAEVIVRSIPCPSADHTQVVSGHRRWGRRGFGLGEGLCLPLHYSTPHRGNLRINPGWKTQSSMIHPNLPTGNLIHEGKWNQQVCISVFLSLAHGEKDKSVQVIPTIMKCKHNTVGCCKRGPVRLPRHMARALYTSTACTQGS